VLNIALFAGLLAVAVATGCLIAYAIVVTFQWLKNKIKEKLNQKNVSKVACADLEKLINECDNTKTIDELESYADEGYTNVIASVDNLGKIKDIDLVKDTSDFIDEQVERFIGHEGMVVVTN